ncbi:zinc ABC transporter permease AztB [Mumia xiangluensis]|uniref:Zinc ABC transporter permease AztB n=1 Tax=Mumia xiangluensis TaxID=1678900 RepID=A0ABW1QPK4_9ACTN
MDLLLEPFTVTFVGRAAVAGMLVAVTCACAGTWVVLRGTAFLGDAMAHGMLPGVAVAALVGAPLHLGAAAAAATMALGVTGLRRHPRLGGDTAVGLLLVGMLALGVIVVSASPSFAVDLTAYLFGDVLGVRPGELGLLAVVAAVTIAVTAVGHRAFLLAAVDERIARTTGLHPRAAQAALLGLLTAAIVASFSVVGTLLVLGMLVAPPAAAVLWTSRVVTAMTLAAALGCAAVVIGLLVSWHASTAAGATVAATAVALFAVSLLASLVRDRRAATTAAPSSIEGTVPA